MRAIARTLAQLAEDPERRGRLAEAGRQRALDFAWPRVVDRIEAVYREAVGQHRAALTGHSAA